MTAQLVMLLFATLSYIARKIAPPLHFFQTGWGAVLLAAVTSVIGAVTSAVQENGFNKQVVLAAAIGALMSFLATANPSKPSAPSSGKPAPLVGPGPSILVLFLIASFALSACKQTPAQFCAQDMNAPSVECELYRVLVSCDSQLETLIANVIKDAANFNIVLFLEDVATSFPTDYDCVSAAVNNYTVKKYGNGSDAHEFFKSADLSVRIHHGMAH